MAVTTVTFRDWEFEVDRELTQQTYESVSIGGADGCGCSDCENYAAYRDNVFSEEVKQLFNDLGIDYRKEVEITSWYILPDGLRCIGGWFHFKGRLISGKNCKIPLPGNSGYSLHLTKIADNFEIGFTEENILTYFSDKTGLVQVEFITYIPWVIDKSLEAT